MPLLNYTTQVPVEKTLSEIQAMLVRAGANRIMMGYEGGQTSAISFLIPTRFGDRGFKLPANIQAVFETIQRQNRQGKVPRRFVTVEQAGRVGWRIIKDWLEAQLAIIETGMVTFDQVMLPYMQVTKGGVTAYEYLEKRQLEMPGLKALPAPDGEAIEAELVE